MDDQGVYDDPGTGAEQPNTEQTRPDGGGVGSRSSEGANKQDRVSAGPNVAHTIAGRSFGASSRNGPQADNSGSANQTSAPNVSPEDRGYRGDSDTGGTGVTGQTGREAGEGDGMSKSAAAESANPGQSTSSPPPQQDL